MFVCLSYFLLVVSQVACGGASWSFFPVFPAEIPLGKYHVEKRQAATVAPGLPVCTPEQLNPAPSCPGYKALAFCDSNDPMISGVIEEANCLFICGKCQLPPPTTAPTIPLTTLAPATSPTICIADASTSCDIYKTLGLCNTFVSDSFSDFLAQNCNATCGECVPPTTTAQTTEGETTVVPSTIGAPTTEGMTTMGAPTTESQRTMAAPTTEGQTTMAAPTTEGQTTMAAPTTEGQTTMAALTTEGQTTVAAPTTEGQSTMAAPTTEGQTTMAAPTTEGQTTMAAPTTEGQTTMAAPTTEGQTTIAAPTTEGQTTMAALTTEGQTTMAAPTTEGQTTMAAPTTEGQTTMAAPTTNGETTLGTPTTEGQTTMVPTTAASVLITLVVFSGLPDPQWRVDLSAFNDSDYQSIQNVGVNPSCIPAKLGYKGFLVQDVARELLIVGSDSEVVRLQQLLLQTIPSGTLPSQLLESISNEVGNVLEECITTGRKRLAPPFGPFLWNNVPNIRRKNNCYNYATLQITNTFAQPGRGGAQIFAMLNGFFLVTAAMADGLQVLIPPPAPADPVPGAPAGARHLVALFVYPGVDFHWYRLDQGGLWSHKPGQTRVTQGDKVGNNIVDPRTAANGNYLFVAFMTSDITAVTIN